MDGPDGSFEERMQTPRKRRGSPSPPPPPLSYGAGTFLDAGPAQLSALQPGYTFVDGPSTMPTIVSVAAEQDVWAAAVLSPSGTCFWICARM